MILDAVAAFKFLFEGYPKYFFAVIKAHFSFYRMLPSTLRKRKDMKSKTNFSYTNSAILNSNIVFDFFIKKMFLFSSFKFNKNDKLSSND